MPEIQMEPAHFDVGARAGFGLGDDLPTQPMIEDARPYSPHNRDPCQNRKQHAETRPVFPAQLQDPFPCGAISIRRRPRVSSSHFVALSLIARWMSTSRIVSATSPTAGIG